MRSWPVLINSSPSQNRRLSILGGLLVFALFSQPTIGLALSEANLPSDGGAVQWQQLAQTKIAPLDGGLSADSELAPTNGEASSPALPAPMTKKAAQAESLRIKIAAQAVAKKTTPNGSSQSAAPAPKSDQPQLQPLAIRIGTHPGFVRLVFDWAKVTDYTLRKESNAIFINFTHNAQVDLTKVYAALPPTIGVFETGIELNTLVVAFTIPDGAKIRDSKFGHLIIVDVLAADRAVAKKIKTRLLPPMTVDPKVEIKPNLQPPPTPSQAQTGATPTAGTDQNPPKPLAAIPAEVYPSQPLGSYPAAVTPSLQTNDLATAEVQVFRLVNPGMTSLRFIFPSETGLAAFEKGDYLYVIFDRHAVFNLSALGKDAPPDWQTPQRLGPNPTADARRLSDGANGALASKPMAAINGRAENLPPGIPEAIALDSGSGIRLRIPSGWQVQVSKPLYPAPLGNSTKAPLPTPGVATGRQTYWAIDFVKTPCATVTCG